MKYLIIECNALEDQYECDADRKPTCITEDYTEYDKHGYEIYEIDAYGHLTKIREWDKITDEYIAYCKYLNDAVSNQPIEVIRLKDGDRSNITKADIKQWCQRFNFSEKVKYVDSEISNYGCYGEEHGKFWCVIGEAQDNMYPLGY